jgi:hypothetical protein
MEIKDTSFSIDLPIKKLKINKWDKFLHDYNNYTKKYIKYYKKSLLGDTISLTKYPYMKMRSEVIAKKLCEAQIQSALNTNQIDRFIKIKIELVNAIS